MEQLGVLTIENGQWKFMYNGKDYWIDTIDVPLDCIALALEKLYPGLFVQLDFGISDNPWFGKHLLQYAIDDLSKEFRDVALVDLAAEVATTEVKICTRCGEDAYYNADVKNWQCPECLGHYSLLERPLQFITKRKFKTGRDERARMREYFNEGRKQVPKRHVEL